MQTKAILRRVYSPKCSPQASATIRRLAWYKGIPMTKALESLVMALPAIIDPSKICLACQDKAGCQECIFRCQITAEEKTALLAAL